MALPFFTRYFTKEVSEGFQNFYDDVNDTAEAIVQHWEFMAAEFKDLDGLLG